MSPTPASQDKIWSGLLRFTHWSLAALVTIALATAWLFRSAPEIGAGLRELHLLAGKLTVLVLMLRVWLMFFGPASERWSALLPALAHLRAALFTPLLWLAQRVLRKSPERLETLLPGSTEPRRLGDIYAYFFDIRAADPPPRNAHHPLWAPVYLLIWIILLVVLLSGLSQLNGQLFAPATATHLHRWGAGVVLWFVVLHLAFVVFSDWKLRACGISTMIHGYRVTADAAIPTVHALRRPPTREKSESEAHLDRAEQAAREATVAREAGSAERPATPTPAPDNRITTIHTQFTND
ncbi:MAG: cytochrome b/b6 domain-containing protein [Thiotrichales bacterium]